MPAEMIISLLVAMDLQRCIGKNQGLPWRMPSDLQRFKILTMGHHIVMGRKTFDSIGRTLPGRISIVITRHPENIFITSEAESLEGQKSLYVANSLENALQIAKSNGEDEVFIIGGGEIFRQALPIATRIYMTIVQANLDCDTYFPEFEIAGWQVITESDLQQGERDQFSSIYTVLERHTLPS